MRRRPSLLALVLLGALSAAPLAGQGPQRAIGIAPPDTARRVPQAHFNPATAVATAAGSWLGIRAGIAVGHAFARPCTCEDPGLTEAIAGAAVGAVLGATLGTALGSSLDGHPAPRGGAIRTGILSTALGGATALMVGRAGGGRAAGISFFLVQALVAGLSDGDW